MGSTRSTAELHPQTITYLEQVEVAFGKASCSPLNNLISEKPLGTLLSTGESQTLIIWISSEEDSAVTFTYISQHFGILSQTRHTNRFSSLEGLNLQAGWKATPHRPAMPRDLVHLRSRLAPALSVLSSERDRSDGKP